MPKKPHGALRATVPMFRAIALLTALIGGVVVLLAAAADFPDAIGKGLVVLLAGWVAVALVCITLFALSELIVVVLEIERRTSHVKTESTAVADPVKSRGLYAEMGTSRRSRRQS